MPQVQQMLDGRPGHQVGAARPGQHGGGREGRWRAEDQDRHADADREVAFAPFLLDRLGDDDAVHALVEERVDGAGDARGVAFHRVDHAEGVARVPDDPFHTHEQRGGTVQGRPQRHHADGAGASGGQRPGGVVAPVAELLGGFEDAPAHLGGDVRLVVEDPRHRLLRDPGQPGHVHAARRSGTPVPPCASRHDVSPMATRQSADSVRRRLSDCAVMSTRSCLRSHAMVVKSSEHIRNAPSEAGRQRGRDPGRALAAAWGAVAHPGTPLPGMARSVAMRDRRPGWMLVEDPVAVPGIPLSRLRRRHPRRPARLHGPAARGRRGRPAQARPAETVRGNSPHENRGDDLMTTVDTSTRKAAA